MIILKFEIKKLLQTPMIWIFIALAVAFNALIILPDIYAADEVNALSREISVTGEYKDYETGNVYENFDTSKIADAVINTYGLWGTYKDFMREKYIKLQGVTDKFAETGVSYDIYAGEATPAIHSQLFKTVIGFIMLEAGLLAVLMILHSLGYERLNKTETTVYSSRTGRGIVKYKYISALICGVVGFVLLAGLTFIMYFSVWDYSGFWNANVSSGNNYLIKYINVPFITWNSFSVAQYFISAVSLAFVLTLVFALFAGLIGLLVRNTYTAFMTLALLLFTLFFAGFAFAQLDFHWGMLAAMFSPVWIWELRLIWFTDMGEFSVFPYHETIAVIINIILLSLLTVISARTLKRKDLL